MPRITLSEDEIRLLLSNEFNRRTQTQVEGANMPTSIGYPASLQDYISGQLIPRLQRGTRHVRGFNNLFEWVPGLSHVTVQGYANYIKIYPEYLKVQGAQGFLAPGYVGRVHLKIVGLPRIPGRRTDFNFGVHPTGSFNAIVCINRIKEAIALIDGAPNMPVEPTHLEILEREAKAEANKRALLESAAKRAAMWESLNEVLLTVVNEFTVESYKEDEFFNLKTKNGVTLKLEVVNEGIKVKEVELPGTLNINETIDILKTFPHLEEMNHANS